MSCASCGPCLTEIGGYAMAIQSPAELLAYELSAIRDAETRAAGALRSQLGSIRNADLRRLLEQRLLQGEQLSQEVGRALERLGGGGKGVTNPAARGLIEETGTLLGAAQTPELKQAVLIAGVQKFEHYCIAVWGTVRALASELGQHELCQAMLRSVEAGYQLDRELTDLAESWVNPTAIEQADMAEGRKT